MQSCSMIAAVFTIVARPIAARACTTARAPMNDPAPIVAETETTAAGSTTLMNAASPNRASQRARVTASPTAA